ncbi:hypothetical protein NBRGN_030_00920 [Nocardia brasiliensis NBRC 14402]|nr:hypothetical protein NBRGN_030_00920 [Nocardia brasiliensis NBRC 14402]SUB53630.1 Uncharacterised protein [Nocardia brasiliensis]
MYGTGTITTMLKKTTVMVDEEDLALIKAAAAREGRPESEIFREAFHIAALRTKRWNKDWDIPTFRSGREWTHDELKQIVHEEIVRRNT